MHSSDGPARRRRLSVSLVFLLAIILAGVPAAAMAHATLLGSVPADGSVLHEAPGAMELVFDEPVTPTALRLIAPDGTGSDLAATGAQSNTVSIRLPELAHGTHTLSWRAVSADGHPVAGSIVFSIGMPMRAGGGEAAGFPLLGPLVWLAGLALYAGLFTGTGGAFFSAWVASPRRPGLARRAIASCVGLAFVAGVASLGLQGLDATGGVPADLLGQRAWMAGLGTSYAITLGVAAVALLLALVSLWAARLGTARLLSATALVGAGVALACSGHASTAPPRLMMQGAVLVHACCVAFWVGSLLPLALLLREAGPGMVASLARFSRAIPVPLVLLVATGVLMAVVQLAGPASLWTTAYGLLLDGKLATVALLLALAAWNRFALTPRLKSGKPAPRHSMVRSIGVEMLLMAVILGFVAGWRLTPPPRSLALAAEAQAPLVLHLTGDGAMVELSLIHAGRGLADASISLMSPGAAKAVTLVLANPAAGIEPIRREAEQLGDGAWRVGNLPLQVAGEWTATLEVLVGDFELRRLEAGFHWQP